jgi:hypothetical protein
LSNQDLEKLTLALTCTREYFIKNYCRVIDINGIKRLSLKEKSNFDCIFWEKGGCLVYTDRPLQCKGFPFWSPFLASREAWDSLADRCPGVNKGPLYSKNEIEAWLKKRTMEPLIALP